MLDLLNKPMEIAPVFDKKSINIVFSFNDEYSKFFSVALQSLIDNSNNEKNYDVIIFSSDIKERSIKMLLQMIPPNFSLRFYNPTNYIENTFQNLNLETKQYWSVEMYYRIFIPLVMQKYERVLYLDSDIVVNSNIDELFSITFDNKEIIAVCDTTSPELYLPKNSSRREHIKKVLGLEDETKYFNSGMLLFNITLIDIQEYTKKILKSSQISTLLYPDQDILNILFEKRVKLISSKWNYGSNVLVCNKNYLSEISGTERKKFLKSRNNPKIIHFISPIKPWNSTGEEFYETFWFYARKTPFYEEILYTMNQSQIDKATREITLFSRLLRDRKIVLWGASEFLVNFLEKYDICNKNILGIIDKNTSKTGTLIRNYRIYSPNDLKELNPDEIIITVIKSNFKKSIYNFMIENNINAELISLV